MTRTKRWTCASAIAVVIAVALSVCSTAATAVPSVRGFDGTTIKIGGIGGFTSFSDAANGAQARFKRFNDTNEIKGVKVDYVGYQDDKNDSATALSVARELVANEGVFAIIPDLSTVTPSQYLTQQHVPWFGWAIDTSYCSDQPTTTLYGFGYSGCLTPPNAKRIPGTSALNYYEYVTKLTGTKNPTIAIIGQDTGKLGISQQASTYQGAGFDVVYAKGALPPPPIGDVSPYVQELLSSNNGKAPDAVLSLAGIPSISIYSSMRASGFKGTFISPLYSDLLVKSMDGSLVTVGGALPFNENTPAQKKMVADIQAFKSGAALNTGVASSYFAADMFIAALKGLKKQGKPITPENVQQFVAKSSFGVSGLYGPIKYPASTQIATPQCTAAVISNGAAFTTAHPYRCSTKTFKINPKFAAAA